MTVVNRLGYDSIAYSIREKKTLTIPFFNLTTSSSKCSLIGEGVNNKLEYIVIHKKEREAGNI